ncbi:MAG: hypothetical protein U0174_12930 [Polyangiaceae bacterium]
MKRRLLSLGVLLAVSACATRSFDLGTNEPAVRTETKEDAGAPKKRVYGCVAWNDDEVFAKRGEACTSACPNADRIGERFTIATQEDVVAVTANKWIFCGQSPFRDVPGARGIEFAPGCRIYLLKFDQEGKLVRGTEQNEQASFDIYVPTGGAPLLDLHFDATHTTQYAIESAKCPNNWLLLASSEGDVMLRPVNASDLVRPEF